MRPGLVEVVHKRVEHLVELLIMEDNQMIEALPSHTAQEAFTDGIGSWSVIGGFENLNVTGFRNPRKAHPKLAIIITDEVLRTRAIGGGFPQLLCRPRVGGGSCDAHVDHFAGVEVDGEEGEERVEEEGRDRQEVGSPRTLGLSVRKRL